MSLRDLKSGDDVVMIVRNRHPETVHRRKVESVGRQLLVVDGSKFRLDTGHLNSKDYPYSKQVFTIKGWARVESEERLRKQIQAIESAIRSRSGIAHLTDDDIARAIALFDELLTKTRKDDHEP